MTTEYRGGRPLTAIVRGNPLPARWSHLASLFSDLADAARTGESATFEEISHRLHAATLVDDVDTFGLSIRSRALANLASAAESRGGLAESESLLHESISWARAVEGAGDGPSDIVDVRRAAVCRLAQLRQLQGEVAASFELLDGLAAEGSSASVPVGPIDLMATLIRAAGLLLLDRLQDADAAYRDVLDRAPAIDGGMVVPALEGLAVIAERSGDLVGAREQLTLLRSLVPNADGAAQIEQNLGQVALRLGDLNAAARHLEAAAEGFAAAGETRLGVQAALASAAVLTERGDRRAAWRLARRALADARATGDRTILSNALQIAGDARCSFGLFPLAERLYVEARSLAEASGHVLEVARIDLRRSIAAQQAANAVLRTGERTRLLGLALQLALPVTLAVDAMRSRLDPGPLREQWVREVVQRSYTNTLRIIADLQHTRLAVELLEFASAATVLDPDDTTTIPPSAMPGAAIAFDEPRIDDLALAASGGPPGHPPRTAPGAPPRVRAFPDGGPEFAAWIDEAERRYGLTIRSAEVVDAW